MVAVQSAQLLSLPVELRLKIFQELLCPPSNHSLVLSHDSDGKPFPLRLHTSIIRVNRQIYHETIHVLYECNKFVIDMYQCVWKYCTGGLYLDRFIKKSKSIKSPPAQQQRDLLPGVITPSCIRRMRHIRLMTSNAALWDGPRGYPQYHRLSQFGEAVLETLAILANEPPSSVRGTLEVMVEPGVHTRHGIFTTRCNHASDGKAWEIAIHLKEIKRTRAVKMEEKVGSATTGVYVTTQVDVEHFILRETERSYCMGTL